MPSSTNLLAVYISYLGAPRIHSQRGTHIRIHTPGRISIQIQNFPIRPSQEKGLRLNFARPGGVYRNIVVLQDNRIRQHTKNKTRGHEGWCIPVDRTMPGNCTHHQHARWRELQNRTENSLSKSEAAFATLSQRGTRSNRMLPQSVVCDHLKFP